MAPLRVGFAYDNYMLLHENYKRYHPERPARLMSIYTHLEKKGLIDECIRIKCPKVDMKHVEKLHKPAMIKEAEESKYNSKLIRKGKEVIKEDGEVSYIGQDVYTNKYSHDCALMAAGASVEACRQVFQEKSVDTVFAAIRPPGHHADCEKIQGFCFFNNVAIAAKYLQDECGKKKICIFDWDVHCGDGTAQLFYEDDSVLYISMHRYDDGSFYPGRIGGP